jgi:hypothetical protein
LEAFKEVLHDQHPPTRLDTDGGLEFSGVFTRFLEEKNIWHHVKDKQDIHGLAPIDSLSGNLKRAIFRRVVAEHDPDWAANLQKTVDGYNATVHSGLQGRSPDEVPHDQELDFALHRFNAEADMHNADVIHARDKKLKDLGAFRVQEPFRTFARSYQAKYGGAVHNVASVEHGIVTDGSGNEYKSKYLLPVPEGSASIAGITEGLTGGSKRIDRVRLQALEPYKKRIENFVAGEGKPEIEVVNYMRSLGMDTLTNAGFNYRDMLKLLGFSTGEGRGLRLTLVTKTAQTTTSAERPVPSAARRVISKRAPLTPAEAAANLRRRVTGKRPG